MRGHEQRAGAALEERLEPEDRLDVEVVRRLVHQQDVGLAEHRACHRHAHLPAARKRADVAVDALVLEAEAMEDFARLALERVAAEVLVFLLDMAEPLEDPVHVAGFRRVSHRGLKVLELVMQVAQPAAAGNHFVDDRPAAHLLDVLPEIADREALRDRDVALVRRLFSGDHPEERRLPGPVRAHEADLVARVQLERGIDKEDLAAGTAC